MLLIKKKRNFMCSWSYCRAVARAERLTHYKRGEEEECGWRGRDGRTDSDEGKLSEMAEETTRTEGFKWWRGCKDEEERWLIRSKDSFSFSVASHVLRMTHPKKLKSTLRSALKQTRLIVAPAETSAWESNCSFVSARFLISAERGTTRRHPNSAPKDCGDKD